MIFSAVVSGAIAATILLFFSHVAPLFGAGIFVRDIDEHRILWKRVTRREAHLMGALLNLFVSMVFAGVYAYLVMIGLFSGFDVISILGWGVVLSVFTGGVIMPLTGHGIFGVKEDAWFPVDLFLTNVAWSVLFWWIIRLWSPMS